MSEIYFVSDMHFGHTNIIEYCKRPFESVSAMDEQLVERWNNTVGATDTVYHLGDWAFHNYHHIGRLNGKIISVPGNHDHERAKKILPFLPNGFTDEVHYLKIDRERRFVLCHYPFETWRREYRYHLHGHCHGIIDDGYGNYAGAKPWRMDVGVDATQLYSPIHVDEVIDTILSRGVQT